MATKQFLTVHVVYSWPYVSSVGSSVNNTHIPPTQFQPTLKVVYPVPLSLQRFGLSFSSVAHVGISTYSWEEGGGDLHIGSLLCGKNVFRMCTQQNITSRSNRPSIQPSCSKYGALRPFAITPPLHSSASVRIYIRIKSCKLTSDDNFQDLVPYVSMGDIRARKHRHESTWLL